MIKINEKSIHFEWWMLQRNPPMDRTTAEYLFRWLSEQNDSDLKSYNDIAVPNIEDGDEYIALVEIEKHLISTLKLQLFDIKPRMSDRVSTLGNIESIPVWDALIRVRNLRLHIKFGENISIGTVESDLKWLRIGMIAGRYENVSNLLALNVKLKAQTGADEKSFLKEKWRSKYRMQLHQIIRQEIATSYRCSISSVVTKLSDIILNSGGEPCSKRNLRRFVEDEAKVLNVDIKRKYNKERR